MERVVYDRESSTHFGQPLDYTARFTVREEPGAGIDHCVCGEGLAP